MCTLNPFSLHCKLRTFSTCWTCFSRVPPEFEGKNSIALQCSFQLHIKLMFEVNSLVGYAVCGLRQICSAVTLTYIGKLESIPENKITKQQCIWIIERFGWNWVLSWKWKQFTPTLTWTAFQLHRDLPYMLMKVKTLYQMKINISDTPYEKTKPSQRALKKIQKFVFWNSWSNDSARGSSGGITDFKLGNSFWSF